MLTDDKFRKAKVYLSEGTSQRKAARGLKVLHKTKLDRVKILQIHLSKMNKKGLRCQGKKRNVRKLVEINLYL